MRLLSYAPLAFLLAACGGAAPAPSTPTPGPLAAAVMTPKKPAADLPASSLRRSSVRATLTAGPSVFLQRIALDERPVFLAGKFHGFRIAALHGPEFWKGVDLAPGDVVTQVNGFPVEHPEEALEAFRSLEVSSELRVEYERDGVPRELRYTIVDDVPAQTSAARPQNEVH